MTQPELDSSRAQVAHYDSEGGERLSWEEGTKVESGRVSSPPPFTPPFTPLSASAKLARARAAKAGQASGGSIRKTRRGQWDPLGLPEQPNGTDNGVHASAGPLEALKERLLWCGFDLEKDPTGSRLVQLAVWDESRHPAINELLENPDVDVAGFKGKAFDLLENKDTPDLYVLANNVAFKEELAGVC